jgi:hypothetical protein
MGPDIAAGRTGVVEPTAAAHSRSGTPCRIGVAAPVRSPWFLGSAVRDGRVDAPAPLVPRRSGPAPRRLVGVGPAAWRGLATTASDPPGTGPGPASRLGPAGAVMVWAGQ